MKLLIGADLVPTKTNEGLFAQGDVLTLFGEELLQIINSADYKIFNLEMPLTDIKTPIEKSGPVLCAPTSTIEGYKALSVNLVTVANNHIMDHGDQGLQATVDLLAANGIDYVGCGNSLQETKKVHLFECDGKTIGVYACAEKEFSIAKENAPGANPFDPLESLDRVAVLKAQCDYVIVLYHGGKENYRYPTPRLQKVCRKLVEKGADLVLCQHSHCIGCEEKYLDGTIVYGQGNTLFDCSNREGWQTGLIVQIEEDFKITYLPLCKTQNTVRLAVGAAGEKILAAFKQRSEEIRQPNAIEEKYRELTDDLWTSYLLKLSAINSRSFWMRAINRLTGQRFTKWLLSHKYNKGALLAVLNCMECETHHEAACYGIAELIKNEQK